MLLTALAAVGVGVMGAIILRGRERAWCAGFAFFAGGYLFLAEGPWLSPWFQPLVVTTHLLLELHSRLAPPVSGATVECSKSPPSRGPRTVTHSCSWAIPSSPCWRAWRAA